MLKKILTLLKPRKDSGVTAESVPDNIIHFDARQSFAHDMGLMAAIRKQSVLAMREYAAAMSVVDATMRSGGFVHSIEVRSRDLSLAMPAITTLDTYGMSYQAIRRNLAQAVLKAGNCMIRVQHRRGVHNG